MILHKLQITVKMQERFYYFSDSLVTKIRQKHRSMSSLQTLMIYGIVDDIEILFRRRVFLTKYDTNDSKENCQWQSCYFSKLWSFSNIGFWQ